MESYITHRQFVALLDALGPNAEDLLDRLNIRDGMASLGRSLCNPPRDRSPEESEEEDSRTFTVTDVLDDAAGYPWLSKAEAESVVRALEGRLRGPYRWDQLEAALRMLGLPVDPPLGWFQWLDETSSYVWTRWTRKDEEAARELGWTIDDYPTAPTMRSIDDDPSTPQAYDVATRMRERAELWWEGYRDRTTRVCSRAAALIDDAAVRCSVGAGPSSKDVAPGPQTGATVTQ